MRGRWSIAAVVLVGLALIGFGRMLWENTAQLLIVIVLVGLVALLYRFPPKRYRHSRPNQTSSRFSHARRPAKPKKVPFRVIEGNKDKDNGNMPKYH